MITSSLTVELLLHFSVKFLPVLPKPPVAGAVAPNPPKVGAVLVLVVEPKPPKLKPAKKNRINMMNNLVYY